MPIYNFTVQGPGGNPNPQAFASVGPVIAVQIEVPAPLAAQFQQQQQPPPPPAVGFALIDTGASITCAEETVLARLGINPTGVAQVSAAGGTATHSVYPARFAFPGTPVPNIDFVGVVGVNLQGQTVPNHGPIIALIGRDILLRCVLVYNGAGGMYSLSF